MQYNTTAHFDPQKQKMKEIHQLKILLVSSFLFWWHLIDSIRNIFKRILLQNIMLVLLLNSFIFDNWWFFWGPTKERGHVQFGSMCTICLAKSYKEQFSSVVKVILVCLQLICAYLWTNISLHLHSCVCFCVMSLYFKTRNPSLGLLSNCTNPLRQFAPEGRQFAPDRL